MAGCRFTNNQELENREEGDKMSRSVRNWVDLPEPLMAKVLKGLPFSSVLALRLVGKKWGAVIISHASICSPNPEVRHFLLATNGQDYISYFPLKDRWFRIWGSPLLAEVFTTGSFFLRGSAGGLLLLVDDDQIIVSNPLTKYYKILPKIPKKDAYEHAAMGMCYHAPSESYMIIVAESDLEKDGSSTTAVYNSTVGSWAITPGMKGKIFSHAFMHLPYSNGSFFGTITSTPTPKADVGVDEYLDSGIDRAYLSSPEADFVVDEKYLLARYRVQQQTWSEVSLPKIVFPHVGEVDGQILLAARYPEVGKVSVWEMSHVEGKWNLLKRKGMARINYFALHRTVFVGEFLFWETDDRPNMLVQNMKLLKSWSKAQELPKGFDPIGPYVAFEPSLTAKP